MTACELVKVITVKIKAIVHKTSFIFQDTKLRKILKLMKKIISLTHDLDLDLNPLRAMTMTYSHAKVQGQRSVGRVETNGRRDGWREGIALPPTLMQLVTIRSVDCA